jgi:hypothetical protein
MVTDNSETRFSAKEEDQPDITLNVGKVKH